MIVLVFMKLLATSLTLGSGNSGGIFAPSLFLGAVAGGSYGVVVNNVFPNITASPGAYALVGMAGLVAGATHAPITALLIIFEMTSDYRIILPLMVTVVFSALVAGRIFQHSIYTAKLARRGIELKGGKDLNVLKAHTVSEIMEDEFESIPASATLHEIFLKIEKSRETYFIVNDHEGLFRGVVSFQDIRNLLSEHTLDHLVIAQDLVSRETFVLRTNDDLEKAHDMFGQRGLFLIPVVDLHQGKRVIGVVRRDNLIDYYNRRLIETLRR